MFTHKLTTTSAVWTPLQPAAMDADQMKEWHSSPAPIGRIGQPSELGPAYVSITVHTAQTETNFAGLPCQ
jgi:hypothetical protein